MVRFYRDVNDRYFNKHLGSLVSRHGGQWIVIVDGRKFGLSPKNRVRSLLARAKKRYPRETILVTPIPTSEDIHCIL